MKPLTVVFSEESFNQNLRKKHRPQKKLDFFVKECYNEWNANKKELPSCGVTNMKKDLSKEFKRRKIQKPSQPLAFFVMHIMRLICRRRKVAFVYDEEYRALEKQQAIFLCQHKSSLDYIYVFAGLGRLDVHVLCGYQNIFQRFVYTLLKKLGVIAKLLYQPDLSATVQMLQAVRIGDSLVIFPEGIQSTSGSCHPINPATMDLLEKLRLPVALITTEGSYFARPRYSSDVKRGKITVRFQKLFDKEDFDTLSHDALYERLLERFRYNEFTDRKEKVPFYGKKPNIYGLENIIYKCPHCEEEACFYTEGDQMICRHCGFAVSMDCYYDIHEKEHPLPFANIDEWYKWQRHVLAKEVQSPDFMLEARVEFRKINTERLSKNYSLVHIGDGVLTLTNRGLRYVGTENGEEVDLFFEAKAVFSMTMSLQYDFDIYYKNKYYNFRLTENQKLMAKWMIASEEIHNLHDAAWKKVSDEVYGYEK